jgi:MFS family permease
MPDAGPPPSIETRASWTIALAAVGILAVGFGAPLLLVVGLKPIAADLGGERSLPGLASALAWLGAGAGGVLMGWLSTRIGTRAVTAIGGLSVALGCAIAAQGEAWHLLLGYGVFVGLFGNGALFPPLMAYVSLWFDRRRGTALALVSSGQYISGMFWPALIERGIAAWGWQRTMVIAGLAAAATVLPVALFVLRPAPAQPVAGAGGGGPETGARVLGMPPNLALGVMALGGFLCCIPMAMPAAHLVAFCADRGVPPVRGAAMLSAMLLAAFVARQFWGWVADRIGGLRAVLLGNLAQTVGMAAFLATSDETGLWFAAGIYGLGFSGIIPAWLLAVRELFPAAEAAWRVPALLFATLGGMAAGAWLAGALYDATGTYAVAWAAGVAVNAAQVLLVAALVWRDRSRHDRSWRDRCPHLDQGVAPVG